MENIADSILTSSFNTTNTSKTFRQLVDEKKFELGISSDNELSKMMDIAYNTLVRLIDTENQKADLFSILKVSRFLGIQLNDIVDIYITSLKPEFVGEIDIAERSNYILNNFNLTALKKIGFIKNTHDFKSINDRILKFFNISSIYLYSQDVVSPTLFSKIQRYSSDEMRKLWILSATAQFEKFNNPNPYDNEKLIALIPKIRPYTRNIETGLLMVIRALYRIGVTVIVQKYLTLTSIRGATFMINDKPCVVITDYKQNYSTLWFTLMHELYHVLFDLKELKSWTFHLSGDNVELSKDLFKEDLANEFAHERLIPQNKLDYIKPLIRQTSVVNNFAEKLNVHAGIIYSFYCYQEKVNRNIDNYAFYQHYFGKSEDAIRLIKINQFQEENTTVFDGLDTVQKIYEYSA